MVKMCPICGHTAELTWRDGKYYCAMCGTHVEETLPEQPKYTAPVQTQINGGVCPICKNKENNSFDGHKYRCALCGSQFDLHEEEPTPVYTPQGNYGSNTDSWRVKELKKQRDKNLIWGVVFLCIFWPVSIYFFYKLYTTNQELKALQGR